MALVEISNVHKSFGEVEVLRGIDLTVEKGEIVTIIGRSGSGKSTLLRCINGLEQINGGEIKVAGEVVHSRSPDLRKLREHVGIVFQQFNVLFDRKEKYYTKSARARTNSSRFAN